MATLILPIDAGESGTIVLTAGAGDYYSGDAALTGPSRIVNLAVTVVLAGTFNTARFDVIVQTAAASVDASDHASWMDLPSSRQNEVSVAGTLRLFAVDPVLDKVRVRFTGSGGGVAAVTATVRWLGETDP